MMRRVMVIVLIATLSLTLLAFVAGCGGDKNKDEAKGYMNSGDDYMDSVSMAQTGLTEKQTQLVTEAMSGDFSSLTGEAGAALTQEFEDTFSQIESDLDAASAEYDKIINLEGVQDYKDYASKMMEAIEIYKKQITGAQDLIKQLSESLVAMAQGEDIDLMSLMVDNPAVQDIQSLGEEADSLVDEALQIKTEKKLDD